MLRLHVISKWHWGAFVKYANFIAVNICRFSIFSVFSLDRREESLAWTRDSKQKLNAMIVWNLIFVGIRILHIYYSQKVTHTNWCVQHISYLFIKVDRRKIKVRQWYHLHFLHNIKNFNLHFHSLIHQYDLRKTIYHWFNFLLNSQKKC